MAGMAQSAVDSLLGRLSALLVDETQLLRGVRGDVHFIRDHPGPAPRGHPDPGAQGPGA